MNVRSRIKRKPKRHNSDQSVGKSTDICVSKVKELWELEVELTRQTPATHLQLFAKARQARLPGTYRNMRIRLQVLRHQLPPAKVLWNVDEATTTAELLSQVSDFFPLEAQGWGLEDYAVHLGGYELLHFQHLGSLLKDDDEIV